MSAPQHQYLWLDLETTGLDPHKCQILEWAAVLAADDRAGNYDPIQCFSGVVHVPDVAALEMDPYVRNMHTVNGLLAECAAADSTLAEGEAFLCELARELGAQPRGIVLAGASVHFDLGFLRVHMPEFAKFLSHRVFDVSTLKMAERTYGDPEGVESDKPKHRALEDCLASLAEARLIRERRWR